MSVQKVIQSLLSDIKEDRLVLPTLPEVALRVRDTLESDDFSLKDVAKQITTDASLSAKFIQFANSPIYRASNEIDSIETAVMRLGASMIRNLVTSIAMQQMFQPTSDISDKLLREVWEHSTTVAALSSVLASPYPHLQKDQALLAGLIHDIGKLPVIKYAEENPELLHDPVMLEKTMSVVHPTIGAAILKTWNFSPELVTVCTDHENLQRNKSGEVDYADIVIVANLQSHIGTDHPHTKLDWEEIPVFDKLGIDPHINLIEMDENSADFEELKSALS